jgi:hypothetical protein
MHGIGRRPIHPGKSKQNALVARVNRSVSQPVLSASLFDSLAQAQQILETGRIENDTRCSHETLSKNRPIEYLNYPGFTRHFLANKHRPSGGV